MYDLLTGPVLWLTFAIFFGGIGYHAYTYYKGLDWKADRVAYAAWPQYGKRGAIRSIVSWLIPFGTHSWRERPGMTIIFFVFHIGIVFVPLFLSAHQVLLRQYLGFSVFSMPQGLADLLSIGVLVSGLFLYLRRLAFPEVRILTTWREVMVLVIAVAPFVTGLLARFHVPGYNTWMILHILSGEIWLVSVVFTKLSHAILFFFSRGQLGMDFGIKRGGMKSDFVW